MTTSSSIDDLLQCPICLEVFHDPKVLDCQHTFCATCLKVYLTSSDKSRTFNSVDCPVCRRRSNLVNNSVESLPGNYIVRDIIERKYGTMTGQRSSDYNQRIRDRLRKLQKIDENENDESKLSDYLVPTLAVVGGLVGGFLIGKGVSKLSKKSKRTK